MALREVRAAWKPLVGWIAMAVAIGYVDYVTPTLLNLTMFYLLPVVGAAWTRGRSVGILVALVSGVASLSGDVIGGELASDLPSLWWNSVSVTVMLVVAAIAIALIRTDRDGLQRLDAERTRTLQLLDQGLAGPARQMAELLDGWDGSLAALKQLLRPRAEEISFLARDFSTMIRLQSGELPLSTAAFDLAELIEELRTVQLGSRKIMVVRPSAPLQVVGDRARTRQALSALFSLAGAVDDLAVNLTRRQGSAEVVISSEGRPNEVPADTIGDGVGLTVELATLLLSAQGGSVQFARNPLSRTLRVTARLPIA